MAWLIVAVVLAVGGLAVLAVCAVRVAVAARGLGREVARTRALLEPQQARLRRELAKMPPSTR